MATPLARSLTAREDHAAEFLVSTSVIESPIQKAIQSLALVQGDGWGNTGVIDLSFGRWLQRRRKALDLTQAELSRRLGCATVTIHKIETEQLRPSRQMAHRLPEELAVAPNERDSFVRFARAEAVESSLFLPAVPGHTGGRRARSNAITCQSPQHASSVANAKCTTGACC